MTDLIDVGDGILVDKSTGEIVTSGAEAAINGMDLAYWSAKALDASAQALAWAAIEGAAKAVIARQCADGVALVGDKVWRIVRPHHSVTDQDALNEQIRGVELTPQERDELLGAVVKYDPRRLPPGLAGLHAAHTRREPSKPYVRVDTVRKLAPGTK